MFNREVNHLDLWDFSNPAASLERFRQLERDATNNADKAFALTHVARAFGLQRDYAQARAALAAADGLLPDAGHGRAQYWLELGRIQHHEKRPADALSSFEKSLSLARDAHEEYVMVDAAHMMAVVVPVEEQAERAEYALSLARAASDKRARQWIGPITNNLGWTYMDMGQPEKAVPPFREALAFRITLQEPTPIRLARYALGCALRRSNGLDEALSVLNEALAMGGSVGYIEEELAECMFLRGDTQQAKAYFQIAYDKLKAHTDLEARDPERLSRLLQRSR